jgi:hypothetical protein
MCFPFFWKHRAAKRPIVELEPFEVDFEEDAVQKEFDSTFNN